MCPIFTPSIKCILLISHQYLPVLRVKPQTSEPEPLSPSVESETSNKRTSTSVAPYGEWNLKQANQYFCLPVVRVKPQTSEKSSQRFSWWTIVNLALTFENSVPHFLDTEICPNGLGIYHKHTKTGQYVHIISYTLWRWKTSWICSLVIELRKYALLIILKRRFNSLRDMLLGMVTHEM